jgi:ssDNA-binding Zn-finger/Zn-ribbon topoisomerase 1
MRLIKVQTGKRLWDLGCPQCNYSSWMEKNKSKETAHQRAARDQKEA